MSRVRPYREQWWRRPRRVSQVLATLALVSAGAPGVAAAKRTHVWSAQLAVEQAYNDNVQQEDGARLRGDFISGIAAKLALAEPKRKPLPYRLGLDILSHIYAEYSDFNYVELGPQAEIEFLPRTLAAAGHWYAPRRLLFEEEINGGDVLYAEHGVTAGLQRKFGAQKNLRTELGFEGVWDDYRSKDDERDSFTPTLVAAARYRLALASIGVALTPSLGFEYQWRQARRDNYDREVAQLQPGIAVELPHGLTLRFRYDRSYRDYLVDADKEAGGRRNNNFDRRDDIEQYQTWLIAALPYIDGLTAGLRYRFRQGRYEQPNRKADTGVTGVDQHFTVHEIGFEIAYAFRSSPATERDRLVAPARDDAGDNQ